MAIANSDIFYLVSFITRIIIIEHEYTHTMVIGRNKRNMLSKMSFFVCPKSPISSKIPSKLLIFVPI